MGISRAYARALFETPEQGAQERNRTREWRHQYALAYIKKGKGLEKEIERRKDINDQRWGELKATLVKDHHKSKEEEQAPPTKEEVEMQKEVIK